MREATGVSEFLESLGRVTRCFVAFSQLVSKVVSYLFMNRGRVAAAGIYVAGERFSSRCIIMEIHYNCNVEFRGFPW